MNNVAVFEREKSLLWPLNIEFWYKQKCDWKSLTRNKIAVFAAILMFRVAHIFFVKLWYGTGGFLHNLEVAHRWAFGYGYLARGWLDGIYSSVHPLGITVLYKFLAWLGLDQIGYLVMVPHIFQALLSAFADYCFYRWSKNSDWSLLLILTSWFWFYMATRPLISTVETCLTTIALRFYPQTDRNETSTYKFLWIISFLIMIRPTAAILWFPLCIFHIRNHIRSVGDFIKAYILIPLIVGATVITIDSYAYGRFVLTLLDSFKKPIAPNAKLLPWYWYFDTALIGMLGLAYLLFAIAVVETLRCYNVYRERFILLITILFTVGIHSCFPEKDPRIILPLLPLCLYIMGDVLNIWCHKKTELTWIFVLLIFISNTVTIFCAAWYRPRGTIEIMTPIEQIAREYRTSDGHRAEFLFLMPCYSTPLYSHVHQNISLRFLTCEPNLSGEEDYINEVDQFYENPATWLQSHVTVHPKSALPTHIVLFDLLQPKIDEFLKSYKLIHNVSHANVFNDSQIGQNVLLFEHVVDVSLSERT